MKKATVTITVDLSAKGQYGYKVVGVECPEGFELGGKIGWQLSQADASIALKEKAKSTEKAKQTTMPAGMDTAMMEKFMAFMAAQSPASSVVVKAAAPAKRGAKKAA